MKSVNKKVGVIGCGNMGQVILGSVVSIVGRRNVFCYDVDKKKLIEIKRNYKVNVLDSNFQLAKNTDVIILAVKPQQIKDVLEEIKTLINSKKLIISIAAGVKIKFIEQFFDTRIQVVRTMPNLPLKVSCGVVAMCKNNFCSKDNYDFAKTIFLQKGIVVEVKEKMIDLITAISGSGPAYIFYISEIIQDVAVDLGLAKKIVPDLVNYTILGAAKMLVEQQKNFSAEELKNKVTSKGGTTEQALNVFYNKKLKKIFKEAIKKAYFRAKELSKIVSKN